MAFTFYIEFGSCPAVRVRKGSPRMERQSIAFLQPIFTSDKILVSAQFIFILRRAKCVRSIWCKVADYWSTCQISHMLGFYCLLNQRRNAFQYNLVLAVSIYIHHKSCSYVGVALQAYFCGLLAWCKWRCHDFLGFLLQSKKCRIV